MSCRPCRIEIRYGKTDNARRRIPLSNRVAAVLEMRTTNAASEWVFPAQTRSTLRHTCLTRWAPHMDPWTLAYLAGHRDMSVTKRYIHPQEQSTRAAIERLLRNVDRRSAISYKGSGGTL